MNAPTTPKKWTWKNRTPTAEKLERPSSVIRSGRWKSLESIALIAADMIRPSARMTVSEWAEKNRYLNNPGSYVGPWRNSKAPYLIEVMDTLTSLKCTACVFAASARSGKSDIWFNWHGYSVDCDPADMIVYFMSRHYAEDWSQTELDKVYHAKPPGKKQSVFERLINPGKRNKTLTRIRFMSGMLLRLSWPAITEMSGKTIPRTALNDMDHMDQDVAKMGHPFYLAKKRTGSFKRHGMTYAESTPGFEVTDPTWLRTSPHEAPPVANGILKIYNHGDRRRWYWKPPCCGVPFEPSFEHMNWDDTLPTIAECAATAHMVCPTCSHKMKQDVREEIHAGYPETCRWIKEGETWDVSGEVLGEGVANDIASFWLKGPAAFGQNWVEMVKEFLQGMEDYEATGDVTALKSNMELSQGEPFQKPRSATARLPETLRARAEDWGAGTTFDTKQPMVPPWVHFLIATIDVQARAFVVQITGVGPTGFTLIDMFKIRHSNRVDESDQRNPLMPIDPAGHLEDWDLIISTVLESSYELNDGSGRRMPIKFTGCDSGGRAGVATNAYAFWKKLRDDDTGVQHQRRFHLIKGEPSKSAPRRMTRYPDSERNDRHAGARGQVPVQFLNSNILKDQLDAILIREEGEDGDGLRWRFPLWAPDFFYKQMTSEKRTVKGWEAPSGRRNEAWDLSYYAIGACLHPDIGWEKMDWSDVQSLPGWAKPWDQNDLIMLPEQSNPMAVAKTSTVDISKLASEWA